MSQQELEIPQKATASGNFSDLEYFCRGHGSLWQSLVKLTELLVKFYLEAVEIFFSQGFWNMSFTVNTTLSLVASIFLTRWLLSQIFKIIKEIIDLAKYLKTRRVEGKNQKIYSQESLDNKFQSFEKKLQELEKKLQEEEQTNQKVFNFEKLVKTIDEIIEEYIESKLKSTYKKKLDELRNENEELQKKLQEQEKPHQKLTICEKLVKILNLRGGDFQDKELISRYNNILTSISSFETILQDQVFIFVFAGKTKNLLFPEKDVRSSTQILKKIRLKTRNVLTKTKVYTKKTLVACALIISLLGNGTRASVRLRSQNISTIQRTAHHPVILPTKIEKIQSYKPIEKENILSIIGSKESQETEHNQAKNSIEQISKETNYMQKQKKKDLRDKKIQAVREKITNQVSIQNN